MNNIKSIAFTVMSLAVFASCNQKQVKESPAQKVEVKTVKPEYFLGESINKLVQDGVAEFNMQGEAKYTLINKLFANIQFSEVGINYYRNEYDKVRNVCYASLVSTKEIDVRYAQIKSFMRDKYGEPAKESRFYSDNGVARYTNTLWDKGFYAISLYATEPLQGENGSIIAVFTITEDIQAFNTFFQ